MKKTIITILFSVITLIGFSQARDTTKPEKVYTVKLTESEINALYNVLVFCKSALPTSQAPANAVSQTLTTIDHLEGQIVHQYQEQAIKPKK